MSPTSQIFDYITQIWQYTCPHAIRVQVNWNMNRKGIVQHTLSIYRYQYSKYTLTFDLIDHTYRLNEEEGGWQCALQHVLDEGPIPAILDRFDINDQYQDVAHLLNTLVQYWVPEGVPADEGVTKTETDITLDETSDDE